MGRILSALFLAVCVLMAAPAESSALPRNFRNVDTFFVGAMPDRRDLDEFKMLGITTLISLHALPPDVRLHGEKLGMKLYSFPLRTQLKHVEEIMSILRDSPEHTVYLHCLHGADRTGAVTAYWLTVERNYEPFNSLASVISPSNFHIKGLIQLGNEYGLCLYIRPESWIGRFSGARNGGLEGLKICGSEWYTRLARNFLSMTLGRPVLRQNESFWNRYNKIPPGRK